MPRRRWAPAVLALVVVAIVATSCGGGDEPEAAGDALQREVRAAARALLAAADDQDAAAFCQRLSPTFMAALAPDSGCPGAIAALSRVEPDAEGSPVVEKSVGEATAAGDTAVVILHDGVTEANPVPARFVRLDGRWVLDEVGPRAELTRVCLEEQLRVQAAVDDYFEDEAEFPADAADLVPSRLDEVPPNHVIGAKGAVEPTGACVIA